jgi:hypothetical protein
LGWTIVEREVRGSGVDAGASVTLVRVGHPVEAAWPGDEGATMHLRG